MGRLKLVTVALAILTAGSAMAQANTRRAVFVGGGDAGRGKCTLEVMVDGSAQVEIRGDSATLRNTGGQAPQWRRFECTGAMPANPQNFRFAGVDGRGRQTLVRDPRNNGGAAVVEIQDSEGGTEGYTFDLLWGSEPAVTGGFRDNRGSIPFDDRPRDRVYENDRGFRQPDGRYRRMTEAEALQACRQSIREQAVNRFRTPNILIRNVAIDDNPGRRDWIAGDLLVRRRFGRQDVYGFSCSVNFDTGNIRSAHIDQFERSLYPNRRY